jgi:hypothetical protein
LGGRRENREARARVRGEARDERGTRHRPVGRGMASAVHGYRAGSHAAKFRRLC